MGVLGRVFDQAALGVPLDTAISTGVKLDGASIGKV